MPGERARPQLAENMPPPKAGGDICPRRFHGSSRTDPEMEDLVPFAEGELPAVSLRECRPVIAQVPFAWFRETSSCTWRFGLFTV